MLHKYRHVGMIAVILSVVLLTANISCGAQRKALTIRIDVSNPTASFMPDEAFGAGLDGLDEQDLERIYSPFNIKTMARAPYGRLAYRLRSELGIEAWHWNAAGSWSDAAHHEGYWTSSDKSDAPVLKSVGYKLPRRGSTIDQAGNDGYSRLDDGDENTFWKSNPYLDAHFTGEDNALYPQWVLIDFGNRCRVNALRILWGEPYATCYEVQYWDSELDYFPSNLVPGVWRAFTGGRIRDGEGAESLLRLENAPVSVRFVRILLSASSGTASRNVDIRDRLGYAIRELYIGTLDGQGRLQDVIRHGPSNERQTVMFVSSTDPWHRAIDRNPQTTQPGFDRIMKSGLGRGNPILTPVSVLYDTPENAAAQIRFLKSRGFPMSQIELGEEPDGQMVSPEHYAALFLQFAKVIHEIDPVLVTGGPSFQSEVDGWHTLADDKGERSWVKRFLAYLRAHNGLDDFGFFSFEWYPFDGPCELPETQLKEQPFLLQKVFDILWREGMPRTIPWIISEYGYSSFARRAEVELPAALLNAEIVAQFLTLGGKTAYYYGLEPREPILETDQCAQPDKLWGNLMMFQAGPSGKSKWLLPAYYGGKMLMTDWAQPTHAPHQLYRASTIMTGDNIPGAVVAYVTRRPDTRWAVMVLNKGADRIELERVLLYGVGPDEVDWKGPFDVIQYSPRQYRWRADGADGHPTRSKPPVRFQVRNEFAAGISLPSLSITVIRNTRAEGGKN